MKILLLALTLLSVSDSVPTEISSDYPEYIDVCTTLIYHPDKTEFNRIGCDESQTLDYMNETVRHPNY